MAQILPVHRRLWTSWPATRLCTGSSTSVTPPCVHGVAESTLYTLLSGVFGLRSPSPFVSSREGAFTRPQKIVMSARASVGDPGSGQARAVVIVRIRPELPVDSRASTETRAYIEDGNAVVASTVSRNTSGSSSYRASQAADIIPCTHAVGPTEGDSKLFENYASQYAHPLELARGVCGLICAPMLCVAPGT